MTFWALSGLINGITSSILGFIVYFRNRKNIINIAYGLFCLSIAVWSYSYFLWQISVDTISALFWCRALMAGAIFIPICYLHHISALLDLYPQKKKIVIFGYIFAFVSLGFDFTPLFVKSVGPKIWFKFWPDAGVAFFPFLAIWFWIVLYGVYIIVKSLHHSTGIKRNQIKYILAATIVGWSGGATNYPLWFNIKIPPIGNILVSGYIAIVAYAVVKYRLMGIKVAFKTIAVPVSSMVILAAVVFLSFPALTNFRSTPLGLAGFTIGVGLVYYFLYNRIGFLINRLFPPHDYSSLLNTYKDKVGKLYSVIEVSDFIITTVQETKDVEAASLLLQDKTKEKYLLSSSFGLGDLKREDLQLKDDSALANFLNKRNHRFKLDILIKDELPKILTDNMECDAIMSDMNKLNAQVALPFIDKEELIGILFIGNKLSGDVYDNEDYDFFKELSERATINIVDAQLREEAEVGRAEQEHKARLSSMGEMTAAMAHEIDNPNYIIIGQAGAIKSKLDKYFPNDERTAEIKAKCDWITETTLRLSAMIKRITDFTKPPKRGEYTAIFPKEMLEKYIKLVEFQLKYNNTELEAHIPDNLPKIQVNVSELEHVFVNLVNNAIDAMEGSKDKLITLTASQVKDYVQIRVSDKGIGISQDRLKAIFLPFVTEKELVRKPKGTGLGLSIAYTIVERQKGRIWAESEGKGKGATFVIELPIYKREEE